MSQKWFIFHNVAQHKLFRILFIMNVFKTMAFISVNRTQQSCIQYIASSSLLRLGQTVDMFLPCLVTDTYSIYIFAIIKRGMPREEGAMLVHVYTIFISVRLCRKLSAYWETVLYWTFSCSENKAVAAIKTHKIQAIMID